MMKVLHVHSGNLYGAELRPDCKPDQGGITDRPVIQTSSVTGLSVFPSDQQKRRALGAPQMLFWRAA